MEITNTVLILIYVVIGLYFVYQIFLKRNPYREEYEKLYNEILNSDKYKVKGQWSDKQR